MITKATQHQDEPKTIRELLARVVDSVDENSNPLYKLGGGASANGYALESGSPELANFVLRVNRDVIRSQSMKEFLKGHTSLTPARKLFNGQNVGQTLLESYGNSFTIHLRQPGTSLQELIKKEMLINGHNDDKSLLEKQEIRANACNNVIHSLLNSRQNENPFIDILETAYQMIKLGYEPDFKINNILYDDTKKKLALVDQTDKPISAYYLNNTLTPAQHLDNEITLMIADLKLYGGEYNSPLLSQLKTALNEAKDEVLAAHAKDNPNAPPKLTFADVSDVKAISLDDPPHVLVNTLRELEKRANIHSR